jgi:hypothetical protein
VCPLGLCGPSWSPDPGHRGRSSRQRNADTAANRRRAVAADKLERPSEMAPRSRRRPERAAARSRTPTRPRRAGRRVLGRYREERLHVVRVGAHRVRPRSTGPNAKNSPTSRCPTTYLSWPPSRATRAPAETRPRESSTSGPRPTKDSGAVSPGDRSPQIRAVPFFRATWRGRHGSGRTGVAPPDSPPRQVGGHARWSCWASPTRTAA